jgi:hypothetical protein
MKTENRAEFAQSRICALTLRSPPGLFHLRSVRSAWVSLLAGLSSGLFSTLLLQPLDVAKTRYAHGACEVALSWTTAWRTDGRLVLHLVAHSSVSSILINAVPVWSTYFDAFEVKPDGPDYGVEWDQHSQGSHSSVAEREQPSESFHAASFTLTHSYAF